MTATPRHQFLNLLQSILLLAGMAVIAWFIVSAIAGQGLAIAIVIGSLLGLLLSPGIPKRLLLNAYGARRLSGREFPEGVAILAELARRAGLPRVPELYYVPSQMPNAFAIGSPDECAVCVSDGLLRLMNRRELAGVLAHEVAHVAHRDLWIMGLADALSRAVSLASWFGQVILLVNLPLILMGAAYVPWEVPLLLIFSPTIMALLQLALSRTREYEADLGGARLSGDPEGLASALLKLERNAGRFWEEMFLPGRRIPEPSLLRTHPPTEERVRRLRALAGPLRQTHPEAPLRLPQTGRIAPPRFGPWGVWR
ncbi:zinc metalloprotease HtpX [Thioclava sp. F28-4]|uniref:zinc metalloprotease HtpX n=1 Tax=Thioclava sp. F28-4 TaxID=1915315 RepID=UPI00099728A7|nr:zinc metalloprotease HtpX [Thioclava sp. F28-4]OOY02657.1 peptidase M48 [Thioclava sp. F28-4]